MSKAAKQLILTGASGFIGSRLQQKLREEKRPFFAFPDSLDLRCTTPEIPGGEGFTVVHLAGLTPQTGLSPGEIFAGNFRMTANLLKALGNSGVSRIVYANTNGYAPAGGKPIGEEHPLELTSAYQLSKYLGEQMLLDFGAARGITTVSLRFFNIYGPGQQEPFLVPYLINRVRDGEPIVLKQPEARRDYVYLDDAVTALILALDVPPEIGGTFNIAAGDAHSSREAAKIVMRLANREVPVRQPDTPPSGPLPDDRIDISRARSVLGWSPHTKFEEGILNLLSQAQTS